MFMLLLMEKLYHFLKTKKLKKSLKYLTKKNKSILIKNSKHDNSAKRKRCFIIGNGPSIAEMDFSLLKKEDVFVVNQIARYKNFNSLNVKYHVLSDPIFLKEDNEHNCLLENELLDTLMMVGKKNPSCVTFAATNDNNGVVKRLRENCTVITFPYYSHMEDYPDLEPTLAKPLPWFNNVLQFAIFIAICIGYKEIYLLGSEQSTIISILKTKMEQSVDTNIYGCVLPANEKTRMINLFNSQSLVSYLSMFKMMYHDFDLLNDFSKKHNVKIVNCTKTTLLDSFEKADVNEILKRNQD